MRTTVLSALAFSIGFVCVVHGQLVKPSLADIQKICPPCDAVARAQSSDKLPREALHDRQWALGPHGVHLPWKAGESVNGHQPGTGSTIVQIDTGVTLHPLIDGHVDRTAADGLFGPGTTSTDPLLTGLLRFPGHGTKTSSVIVARPSGKMDVHGIAPGAHLIPVRATEGVVLFDGTVGELNADYHRIARALNEVANGAGGLFNAKIDVVSMSLGGWPPTADLCASVEKATNAGAIVVVAAGNDVRRTTYPAECPTAIAVAGSTYYEAPWSGSAGSAKVAVAAPAEAVWTASVMDGQFCIEASSGTSFATALVAGMAAEWIARKRASGNMPAHPAEEFRAALRKSARAWKENKWSKNYGSGVADMTALLALDR